MRNIKSTLICWPGDHFLMLDGTKYPEGTVATMWRTLNEVFEKDSDHQGFLIETNRFCEIEGITYDHWPTVIRPNE